MINKIKILLFINISFFITKNAISQSGFDLIYFDYTTIPNNEYEGDDENNFTSSIRSFNTGINFPIFKTDKTIFFNGLNYRKLNTNINNNDNISPYIHDLSSMGYNLRVLKKVGKVGLFFATEFKYSANKLTDFNFKRMNYRGAFGGIKNFENRNIELLVIGIGGSFDYSSPTVLPILIINTKLTKKIRFDAILPINSKLSYQLFENSYIGLNHFANFIAYDIKNENNEGIEFGKFRSLNAGLYFEQKLRSRFYLMVNGGINARNIFMIYNNKNKTDEYIADTNYFFNLSLSYKIRRNEIKSP